MSAHISRQIGDLRNLVIGLDQSVTVVGQHVAAVGQEQRETRGELSTLRAEFTDFRAHYQRTADKQLAETRVGVLQDQLNQLYGHHDVVRRSATGVLQAFDVGLVSEETVHQVGEQLMIQTPRYWLAPVLVALARWAGDDQAGCVRAVEEAFRRSTDKTSLFMALVLRRQRRQDSAVRWLRHYLSAQDPAALGRNFAVILQCISHGAFGPAGVRLMRECLEGWRDLLLRDEEKRTAQVGHWRAYLDTHIGPSASGEFPRLAAISPQWPQMDAVLARAGAHRSILATYSAILEAEPEPLDRLEDAVDDILDLLVGEFDDEELPLRRDLARNKAIVAYEGDVARAEQAVEADGRTLETTLDYLTIQTRSALNPAAIGVSTSTQRMALAACHDWFAEAHADFSKDYRAQLPGDVQAVFGSGHSIGAKAFALPLWTGSFTEPTKKLEGSLGRHWDKHGKAYIDGFAFDKRKVVIAACVMAAVLLGVSLCAGIGAGLIVTVLASCVCGAVLYGQYRKAMDKQEEARKFIETCKADSITQLRAASAELVDWTSRFTDADQLEPEVRAMITQLATAGHPAAPFERRAIGVADVKGA